MRCDADDCPACQAGVVFSDDLAVTEDAVAADPTLPLRLALHDALAGVYRVATGMRDAGRSSHRRA